MNISDFYNLSQAIIEVIEDRFEFFNMILSIIEDGKNR